MNLINLLKWKEDYYQHERILPYTVENYEKSKLINNEEINVEDIISDLVDNINAGYYPCYIHPPERFIHEKCNNFYYMKESRQTAERIRITHLTVDEISTVITNLIKNNPTGRFLYISFTKEKYNDKYNGWRFEPTTIQVIGYNPYETYPKFHYDVFKHIPH